MQQKNLNKFLMIFFSHFSTKVFLPHTKNDTSFIKSHQSGTFWLVREERSTAVVQYPF